MRRWWAIPLLVAPVIASGVALACIPQARLVSLKPNAFGPPGAEIAVEGLAFDEGSVEIRWNASDGPQLARAEGPTFSVPVRIPDVPPGLYALVALSRAPDGSIGNAGRAAFQVTPAAGVPDRPPDRRPVRTTGERRSATSTGDLALAAGGGALLVLLGGAGGAALTRRRRPPPA